jgi:hypothetical protein
MPAHPTGLWSDLGSLVNRRPNLDEKYTSNGKRLS